MNEQGQIASPLTLLNEWRDRVDQADLHELLLLGFTVDLPFLEKVALPAARSLNARVTIIGDVSMGLYDPLDVRSAGRTYLHAFAACPGVFHPKLALLVGEHEVVAGIGSGNPTAAGWGYNDEIWSVLRGSRSEAPVALRQLAEWLKGLADHARVFMPDYAAGILGELAGRLAELPANTVGEVEVRHNLTEGLLERLPDGPVEELALYAPFLDQSGRTIARLVERFDPARIIVGLQERWTSYNGDALLKSIAGRETELRFLPESVPRHGKLLQWLVDGRYHSLTGSANLTGAALVKDTRSGGNCELAVLSTADTSLMPEGEVCSRSVLRGRDTARSITSRPTLFMLGALLTGRGLAVTLAGPYDFEVTIESSPDGSPGSWSVIGTVPAGETTRTFAVPETAGAVVRAVDTRPGGTLVQSPAVFAIHPARCARRMPEEGRPRLRHDYGEEIFTDEEQARRFQYDLIRLADQLVGHKDAKAEVPAPRTADAPVAQDRWLKYLDDCERMIGFRLTSSLFGRLVSEIPGLPPGTGWSITTGRIDPNGSSDEEEEEEPAGTPRGLLPEEKKNWRRWTGRAVTRMSPSPPATAPPLLLRILVARIFVQLLGHGVWDLDDETWRDDLARLLPALVPGPQDDAPEESRQHVAVLAAVCMSLLRSGASLTGGSHKDLLATRTWPAVKGLIAEAEPDLASDLLLSPVLPRAEVVTRSELENVVRLAEDEDPLAVVREALAGEKWRLERIRGIYRVTGSFTNPLPVAARVATLLEEHDAFPLVHAAASGRWAFIAWRRPDLLLASAPAGSAWRLYRLPGSSSPAALLSTGQGIPSTGLMGRPVRLGLVPPGRVLGLLEEAGQEHLVLLEDLNSTTDSFMKA